jgi:hypothetical protein
VLDVWLKEWAGMDDDPLFPTMRGTKLSRDALERLVQKHTLVASKSCPPLIGKRVSPHVLRHSTAMNLLHHGVDQSVIALWLGHESVQTTQMYMHADLRLKEKALARITAPESKPGRYRPKDSLIDNPGREKALAAAETVAGVAIFPNFSAEQRVQGFTDFNDLAIQNPELVSRQLDDVLHGVKEQGLAASQSIELAPAV